MSAFKVLALLALVCAASGIEIRGCGTSSNVSLTIAFDTCEKTEQSWSKLVLASGAVANNTAIASFTTYSDTTCATMVATTSLTCNCDGKTNTDQQMVCSASAILPSAFLIIAAIMALF
eukprot:TRINITY_DN75_c0_g1_i1.p1 TRINITY_DN75_c0_g1~~TRINITY_DN75_c0_g1_i1.p1  ORF type:complete len:119 (+),score=32.76 TRINITY_DN75_c0_g1_i1:78-434(+)